MRRSNTKKLVRCALIAALYAAISLALTPITYGMMQARISEALTLLPILTPDAIAGVALGCFLTNLA
ncbi:MAG: QueT transporter family protein, partial [Ruthenibacterium sp.]